jgi:hypothetical protein
MSEICASITVSQELYNNHVEPHGISNCLNVSLMKEIIRKYNNTVIDFLKIMIHSAIINEIGKTKNVIRCGLNTITHTFHLVFHLTQNINTTYDLCQKACYYYLEYIEQMNEFAVDIVQSETRNNQIDLHHEYVQNFNNNDAIMFVYNKTINGIRSTQSTSVGEVIQNNKNVTSTQNSTTYIFLKNMSSIAHIILNWQYVELSTEQRLVVCQTHLYKYISLLLLHNTTESSNVYETVLYPITSIEYIQSKLKMDFNKYNDFLDEYYKHIKKLQKHNLLPSESELCNHRFQLLYDKDSKCMDIFMTKSTKYFVKYIFPE